MKVRWWAYNHCLFVSYLTSVPFGYGWISDTKFQKFSDKDWIWIIKKCVGYGSGVKKSIFAHLCCTVVVNIPNHLCTTYYWMFPCTSHFHQLKIFFPYEELYDLLLSPFMFLTSIVTLF